MQRSQTHKRSREPSVKPSTIVISANSCWNIVNFRGGLICALSAKGYRIVVVAPEDGYSSRVVELGAEFVPIEINSSGLSAAEDLWLLFRYLKILREVKPSAFLGFTAKPNIYGSMAARFAGAKVINNVSGLGTAYIKPGPLTLLVTWLYRFSLRASSTIFFQNRDDMDLFIAKRIVRPGQARLLPGSGINLAHFRPRGARPGARGPFRFLLVARLLWDKGIREYVEAARLVRTSHPQVRFQLLGALGANNRTAVPSAFVERWRAEDLIDYLGETDDVREAMGEADCIVLPSYREGLPRSLLEGSAMGKPLIATDVPGCREVVVEGETGYLCAAGSPASLASAMRRTLEATASERFAMGERGRRKVEQEFCETLVIAKYLEAIGTREWIGIPGVLSNDSF